MSSFSLREMLINQIRFIKLICPGHLHITFGKINPLVKCKAYHPLTHLLRNMGVVGPVVFTDHTKAFSDFRRQNSDLHQAN